MGSLLAGKPFSLTVFQRSKLSGNPLGRQLTIYQSIKRGGKTQMNKSQDQTLSNSYVGGQHDLNIKIGYS